MWAVVLLSYHEFQIDNIKFFADATNQIDT
jgi:hypothetical protein